MPKQTLLIAFTFLLAPNLAGADTLSVTPAAATLRGKDARQRVLVTLTKDGKAIDATS
jgi:hypothetical protein